MSTGLSGLYKNTRGARMAENANNIDCEHYNKHRGNCKLLKKLYCTIEKKPCCFHRPTTDGTTNER